MLQLSHLLNQGYFNLSHLGWFDIVLFNPEEGAVHKGPTKLEVATDSEESEDSEDEDHEPKKKKVKEKQTLVTIKMVNQWSKALQVRLYL